MPDNTLIFAIGFVLSVLAGIAFTIVSIVPAWAVHVPQSGYLAQASGIAAIACFVLAATSDDYRDQL